ncbi:MAG: vWA domain-containing protein [Burkholderiales bacterium]
MSFAWSPLEALALLAGVALAVLGLYLLRPPPQRIVVTSTLIWERVLDAQRGVLQRWRWWISLLLASAIALALAAALTQPRFAAATGAPREVVIVIDNSSSMSAWRSDARTRFDHAVEAARAEILQAGPGARILVTDTLRTAVSGAFLTGHEAEAVLDTLRPGAGGHARFPDLAAYPKADAPRDVVLVTDGVATLDVPANVRTVSVFEPAPNVGITAFDVRALATDPARHDAFVEIGNADTATAKVSVRIEGPGHAPVTREVQVPARGFAAVSVPVTDFGGGALRASVESSGDSLDVDNAAFAFLPFNRHLRVALVTGGNAPLERALRLDSRVHLTVLLPARYAAAGSAFDLYVFDRFVPSTPPLAPALLFHPGAAPWLPASTGDRSAPVIANATDRHPILENVSLADVEIERARTFRMPGADDAMVALARTAEGGVLAAASESAPRWFALGFTVGESSLASQASFPVLLGNAIGWLTAEKAPQMQPVGPVRVPIPDAKVSAMQAGRLDVRHVPGATLFTLPAPDFVTVDAKGARMRVLANVLDPTVTDINASSLSTVRTPSSTPTRGVRSSDGQLWRVLLGLAGLLLLAEWLAYHRRVTV